MQAVTIQADKGLDDVMTEWLVNLVRAMPVGPEGLKFNGNLHNGTIVNHRAAGVWTVSFRPCQRTWEHAVPKTAQTVGPRISVQFRPRGVR